MNTHHPLRDAASGLVEAAQAFQVAADQPTSHAAASGALESLEEALQALGGAWYRVAGDASLAEEGGPDEAEVSRTAALRDVALALASCARACRLARSPSTPVAPPRVTTNGVRPRDVFPRFRRYERPKVRIP